MMCDVQPRPGYFLLNSRNTFLMLRAISVDFYEREKEKIKRDQTW